MSIMRLHVGSWFGALAIPAFDEDVDFNSSGVWINIECPLDEWKTWRLLLEPPDRIPAMINGTPGHIIIVDAQPQVRRTKLLVKIKFYPPT
jgi:hypothetical protein